MAVMNMVNSNINQWTLLAAMIPVVFNISVGSLEPIAFTSLAWHELALTIAQSFLGGLLLMDLRFSFWDALILFGLWLAQFVVAPWREEITVVYLVWIGWEVVKIGSVYLQKGEWPKAIALMSRFLREGKS